MNGTVVIESAFGVTETQKITHEDEIFNAYLEDVYVNKDMINISVVDALLFNLLDFLKTMVVDTGNEIQFLFNDYKDTDFKYNAMATDKMVLIKNYDDLANATHVDTLNNFWRAQDFRFYINNNHYSN